MLRTAPGNIYPSKGMSADGKLKRGYPEGEPPTISYAAGTASQVMCGDALTPF